MISILKAHTNCPPWTVDDNFTRSKRFMGEEVDICGRWDADSPCIRELFATGHSTIPFNWKLMVDWKGEDWNESKVFGWEVFCTMLKFARDERRSPSSFKTTQPISRASHMKAKEKQAAKVFTSYYSDDSSTNYSSSDEEANSDNGYDIDVEDEVCTHSKANGNFYGRSIVIGKLWAAIQTELLTHRRIAEGDAWLSENFNMGAVLDGLKSGGLISMPLLDDDMMNEFCPCGRFRGVLDEACACVYEACKHYFANLDDWNRTSYIVMPAGENYSWY
ncbi:hypothetical protein PVAG01_06866 [Phlyctema vagabunda]|uniref:Uncharacterized protein n=1 Tax=Phlyctema vagabunda TaxID=108571 RepID=A0ABR4PHD8_9HELO